MEVPKPYQEKPNLYEKWVDTLYKNLRETVRKAGIRYVQHLDSLRATYGQAATAARMCDGDWTLSAVSPTVNLILKIHEGLEEAKYIGKITEDEYEKAEDLLTDMHTNAIAAIEQILGERCGCQWKKND